MAAKRKALHEEADDGVAPAALQGEIDLQGGEQLVTVAGERFCGVEPNVTLPADGELAARMLEGKEKVLQDSNDGGEGRIRCGTTRRHARKHRHVSRRSALAHAAVAKSVPRKSLWAASPSLPSANSHRQSLLFQVFLEYSQPPL